MKINYNTLNKYGYIYGKISEDNNNVFIENIDKNKINNEKLIGKIINNNEDDYEKENLKLIIIKDYKLKNQINKVIYKNNLINIIHFIKNNNNINNNNKTKNQNLYNFFINFLIIFLKIIFFSWYFYICHNYKNSMIDDVIKFLINYPLGIKINYYISVVLSYFLLNILKINLLILLNKWFVIILIILNILNMFKLIKIDFNKIIFNEILNYITKYIISIFLIILNYLFNLVKKFKSLINNSKYDENIKNYVYYKTKNKYKLIISLFLLLLIYICINFFLFFILILIIYYFLKIIQVN